MLSIEEIEERGANELHVLAGRETHRPADENSGGFHCERLRPTILHIYPIWVFVNYRTWV